MCEPTALLPTGDIIQTHAKPAGHGYYANFDPHAVRVAKQNARKNRVDGRLKIFRGDLTKMPRKPARQYDLVCANLISDLLVAERRRIVNRFKPGGTLVLAGILAAEFDQVESAFADAKLKLRSSRAENEWRSGAFCFF